MSALTTIIVFISVQVALFSMAGAAAFLLLKHRGPNTAATVAAGALGVILVLSLLAWSPWPRWSLANAAGSHTVDQKMAVKAGRIDTSSDAVPNPEPAAEESQETFESLPAIWWRSALDWMQTAGERPRAETSGSAGWRNWLPIAFGIGIAFCLARLAAGMWAVWSFRRKSQPIPDSDLLESVRELSVEFGSPAIAVRETTMLQSAATIGWWQPILLLPADWRSWTELERRVVLAHELAHVVRRDYLTGLLARLAVAIHFYQPLVLWLGRQLRIQQELAADSRAAVVAGDRQTYLATLAQLALKADEQPAPWAARAFLPGTSMLIRRVAWLKRRGVRVEQSLGRIGKWTLIAAMAAVALGVAGIRGPSGAGSSAALGAAPEEPQAKPQAVGESKSDAAGGVTAPQEGTMNGTLEITEQRTMQYIPADATTVAVISPSRLAQSPIVRKFFDITKGGGLEKELGIPLEEVKDVKLVTMPERMGGSRAIVQSDKPFDWKKRVLDRPGVQTKQLDNATYYEWKELANVVGVCAYIPDDRTIIFCSEAELRKIVAGNEKLLSGFNTGSLTSSEFAVWIDKKFLRQAMDRPGAQADKTWAMFRPVIDQVKSAVFSGGFTQIPKEKQNELSMGLIIDAESNDAAKQIAGTLNAALTLAQNFMATGEKQTAAALEDPTKVSAEAQAALAGMRFASTALQNIKIEVNSGSPQVVAQLRLDITEETLTAILMPAIRSADVAKARSQSINNLKIQSMAMMQYLQANKRFPSTAMLGEDGKTRHSWRVALLPYLGIPDAEELYKEYRFNEPWDSEHNKELLTKMPVVYRNPLDVHGNTNASYFMGSGNGTLGGAEEGVTQQQVVDGLHYTILLVEAKRDVPWTKPKDIEIDADASKPLPKLGGYFPGEVSVALADGSVRTLNETLDPKILHALFTYAGKEVVDDSMTSVWTLPKNSKGPPERSPKIPQAVLELERQLREHPDDPKLHNDLGLELAKVGRMPEAITAYQKALQLKPDYAEPHLNLGLSLLRLNREQEASEHYQKALQLKPELGEGQKTWRELAIGQLEKALELARSQGLSDQAKEIDRQLDSLRATKDKVEK